MGLRKLGYYKIAYPSLVHRSDELMPILLSTLDGKKEAALGKNDLATIQQQMFNLGFTKWPILSFGL